ncbi:MAG: hypothetical protein ACRC46_00235 [Thermoguttaceae bacterium]
MAYETKVILIALAELACRTHSREVYNAIAKMANAEGVVLKPYKEALAEIEEDRLKTD